MGGDERRDIPVVEVEGVVNKEIMPRDVLTDTVDTIGPEDKENCLEALLSTCGVIVFSDSKKGFAGMLHRSISDDDELDYELVIELKGRLAKAGINVRDLDFRVIGLGHENYQRLKMYFLNELENTVLPEVEGQEKWNVRVYKKDGRVEFFDRVGECDYRKEEEYERDLENGWKQNQEIWDWEDEKEEMED